MKTYKISYDWQDLAEVEIDEAKALSLLKQMIFFWMGGEEKLDDNDGDIVKTWLKQLGAFIIRRGRIPSDDEGWCVLDGTYGINVLRWHEWEMDEDQIEVENI